MCTTLCGKQVSVEGFGTRVVELLNSAALVQMISIGHRTGLFDTMDRLAPSTSEEIAQAGGLDERYVREWLGAMVTGGVVDYDAGAGTYDLPAEHAALLTRRAAPNNLAATTQFVPLLAQVEDRVVECFYSGGGVPYSAYPRFHQVMAEESDQTVIGGLFDHILALAPELEERLESGIDVLDVGCGRGRAMLAMAQRFPNSRFEGYDLSREAIGYARSQAAQRGLRNVRFEARDLSTFSEPDSFDLITAFDAIHDQAAPASVLAGVAGALREGGLFLMQDIGGSSDLARKMDTPLAPFIYTISCMHCMTVSLAQGGAGLGAAWGEELAQRMLAEAGFGSVEVCRLEHDIMNAYYLARR